MDGGAVVVGGGGGAGLHHAPQRQRVTAKQIKTKTRRREDLLGPGGARHDG